jgi:hypothetical protein
LLQCCPIVTTLFKAAFIASRGVSRWHKLQACCGQQRNHILGVASAKPPAAQVRASQSPNNAAWRLSFLLGQKSLQPME